jgi:branched-chain amino acid transport system substrate-binding protein
VAIGTVGIQSGIIGAYVLGGVKGAQTWVSSINAAGGLNCHPLRYVVQDDGGDPSRNQALVQQLVENDHVLAFVYMDDVLSGTGSVSYIEQHQIPVIGTDTDDPWDYTSPMWFPQATSGDDGAFGAGWAGLATAAVAQGKTKLATVSCIEASICSGVYTLAPAYAAKFGLSLVYRGQVSIAQPDYTSSCQAAKNAGAQAFFMALDGNSDERLARSCGSVNFQPLSGGTGTAVPLSAASDPNLEGFIVGDVAIPWMVTSNPANQQFLAAMKQYAPSVQVNPDTTLGWVAGKILELAAQHLSEPPTSESILRGLWSIKNNDFGGMTGPLTFHQNQNNPQPFCYWTTQIHNRQWTVLNGGQRTCL